VIRIVARGRTKHRDEYKPHSARVVRVRAGLEDASIHHDRLANLKPSRVERLVEPPAAGLSSPGGADTHVGRADDIKLTPTPGDANHKTDESGRVRLTRQDLAVEDDDAPGIEPLDPHDVLERSP
jgi:hypothetical protein